MNAAVVTERLQVQADWLTEIVGTAVDPNTIADIDPTDLVNMLGACAQLVQVGALLAAFTAQRLTEIAAEALGT